MPYVVLLKPAAQRELDRLRGVAHFAVRGVILALAAEPRPLGSRKLAGREDLWRLRIRIDGRAWRLIYRVDDKNDLVVVTRVARRDEGTYRSL